MLGNIDWRSRDADISAWLSLTVTECHNSYKILAATTSPHLTSPDSIFPSLFHWTFSAWRQSPSPSPTFNPGLAHIKCFIIKQHKSTHTRWDRLSLSTFPVLLLMLLQVWQSRHSHGQLRLPPSFSLSQDHQITGTHDYDTGLDPGQDQLKTAGDNSKYFSQTSHLSKAFYQILGINSLLILIHYIHMNEICIEIINMFLK